MTNFKIEFCDINGNEVYSVTKSFNSEQEANSYAKTILATTSDECRQFNIYTF